MTKSQDAVLGIGKEEIYKQQQSMSLMSNGEGEVMLPYRIVEVSSEDPNHPVSQLEQHGNGNGDGDGKRSSDNGNGNNEGWQSKRNCTYPQYIIIKPLKYDATQQHLDSDESIFDLAKMQILIHNHKIPQKIEIFTSQLSSSSSLNSNTPRKKTHNREDNVMSIIPNKHSTPLSSSITNRIKFQRLGYITFDDNMKSQYLARELKSISLNVKVTYIKLVVHACHGYKEVNQSVDVAAGYGEKNSDGSTSIHNLSNCVAKGNNEVNPFYQVGIVNIGLFQDKKDQVNIAIQEEESSILVKQLESVNVKMSIQEKPLQHEDKVRTSIGTNTSTIIKGDDITKTKISPPPSSHRRIDANRKTSKPVNPNEIVDFQSRLAKLEQMKHAMAEREDFDTAAQIKAIVVDINSLLTTFQELQLDMRRAAENEDYVQASMVKTKRDKARGNAMNALLKAEVDIGSLVVSYDEGSYCLQRDNQSKSKNSQLEDLSLSTIHRFVEDDPSIAMTMTGRSFQINIEDRPIISRQNSSYQSKEEKPLEEDEHLQHGRDLSHCNDSDESGEHPLEGVPNYEKLPYPDEYHQSEGGLAISLSSSDSLTSTDSIVKIESILGLYRTKCFLSKNWLLREAALLKLSSILPTIIATYTGENQTRIDWWDTFSRSICIILERAIDDKIVQVFLTGLILLDDCLVEIDKSQLSQKETISLLGNVVKNVVDKLSSGNQKVVEGAETTLMSLALYDGVGPSYIGSQIMKRMESKDSKGKLVCARFRLLRDIINEFGTEAPNGRKTMNFAQTYGFGHKDADVREAVKELTVALFLRDGKSIVSMLDGLSERQEKEYKISFASAKQAMEVREMGALHRDRKLVDAEDNISEINRVLSPNIGKRNLITPTPRGRGRGRGRRQLTEKNVGIPRAF